ILPAAPAIPPAKVGSCERQMMRRIVSSVALEGGTMAGKGTRWAAGFFGLWLLLPGAARAGWLYDWCHCQKPSYHKLNYLVPEIDRIHAFHCRIPIYTYARDLHPDIPLHYRPVV